MSHTTSTTPGAEPAAASPGRPAGTNGPGSAAVAAAPGRSRRTPESSLDRLARRVLGLRDAEPRALVDLQGSLVLSAVRCIVTYVLVPVVVPLIAWAGLVARPVGLVLAALAVAMSIRSLRRVWQADWIHRWTYTGFIAVVVALLGVGIVLDARILWG